MRLNQKLSSVEKDGKGLIVVTTDRNGIEYEYFADAMLVAVGRDRNSEALNLEAAGIDPHEVTELVTSGPFALVRNPIFTAMGITLLGVTLLSPSAMTTLAFVPFDLAKGVLAVLLTGAVLVAFPRLASQRR